MIEELVLQQVELPLPILYNLPVISPHLTAEKKGIASHFDRYKDEELGRACRLSIGLRNV